MDPTLYFCLTVVAALSLVALVALAGIFYGHKVKMAYRSRDHLGDMSVGSEP
jgi:hypothetical protein